METPEILVRGDYKYAAAGEGEPLVLLHGLFGALSNFEAVLAHFSQHFRVIIPMLPIYELPMLKTSAAAIAKHIAGFVDDLGLERFHVLGGGAREQEEDELRDRLLYCMRAKVTHGA